MYPIVRWKMHGKNTTQKEAKTKYKHITKNILLYGTTEPANGALNKSLGIKLKRSYLI